MTDDIQRRKQEHLDQCLDPRVRGEGAGLGGVRLPYDAMFRVAPRELDTSSRVAGIPIRFPLMIGAMTGGLPSAAPLNTALRALAAEHGIAMETGSIRILLGRPELADTFGAGRTDALFANIGASEIRADNADEIARICEKIGASGLCIHLNGLQEYVQDGGNRAFTCRPDTLASFVARFPMPVLVKEVGSGIFGKCAQTLAKLPIAGIETASRGGTSWVMIEALRRKTPLREENVRALNGLGCDLRTAIADCRAALGPNRTLIASGGIAAPDELVKCLFCGADCAAVAQPLYKVWHEKSIDGLSSWIAEFIEIAKLIWRSTGARNLNELKALARQSF